MYHLQLAGEYRTLESHHDRKIAMQRACELQDQEPSDYVILIARDGHFVGDAVDGWYPPESNENALYEAQYAYACGYFD